MNDFDLAKEALTYSTGLTRAHFSRLEASGASLREIGRLCGRQFPIGLAKIDWQRNGFWEPSESGNPALILPVCETEWFEIWDMLIDTCTVVDLIALRTDRPARWAWRTGVAWALGEDLLIDPTSEPVLIVGDPLRWIGSGGNAACILDWSKSSPAWHALRHGPPLIVENEHLRRRLQRALAASIRLPEMEVADAA